MRKSTALATQSPLSDFNGFDFDMFLKCKPYLAPKDQCIITSITDRILKTINQNQTSIRILDVGSGDATVISSICDHLHNIYGNKLHRNILLSVDCVEPCHKAINLIQRAAAKMESSETLIKPQHKTIEKFLSDDTHGYQTIICCHSLYHIPKRRWGYIIQSLLPILRPGGVLLLNLVSRQSDIYRIKDAIGKLGDIDFLPKKYASYGYEYYAEDLEEILFRFGDTWEQEIISADISFSQREVDEAIKELQDRGNNSSLIHFLAFMFRLQTEDLLAIGKSQLVNFLAPLSDGISFKSIDKMFVFRRIS